MAKSSPRKGLEQQIAELNALRPNPDTPDGRVLLGKALTATRVPLVAAAANIIAEAELGGFEPALTSAFEHWLEQPGKSDPGCAAKTSLVRALYRLGARTHALYLRAIRCVQKEPGWGGAEDSAVEIRGVSALALVRSGYFDALIESAELLADPQPLARLAAAQAIAYSERQDVGIPLLRFKARGGDADPRVMAACFSGLLSLAPHGSLEFVASFIDAADEPTQEAALLALGESRLESALPALQRTAQAALRPELRNTAFVAIAMLRNDAARAYLLQVLRDETPEQAQRVLSALAPYRSLESLRAQVLSIVRERADAKLLAHAERLFPVV